MTGKKSTMTPEPDYQAETAAGESILYMGGAIKALGDGRVGGYLVRFSTPEDPDLVGDYFTKDTDFGGHDSSDTYFNHGIPVYVEGQPFGPGRKQLGTATLRQDDIGVWAEAVLNERDEYENFIRQMIAAGKIAWSSGTAPHLVETVPTGKAQWLKKWPLGLDASFTHTPCEFRNQIMTLKSLSELQRPADRLVQAGSYAGLRQQTQAAPEGEPEGARKSPASEGSSTVGPVKHIQLRARAYLLTIGE